MASQFPNHSDVSSSKVSPQKAHLPHLGRAMTDVQELKQVPGMC